MITHYFRTLKDTEMKQMDSPRVGVWTHVESPTTEEQKRLVSEFSLDEAILEDARDFFEVPRFERSQGATYFFTRYPFDEIKEDVETAPLLLVVGESFVLTIAQRDVPCFKPFMEGKKEIHTTQKARLFITLMSAVTREFENKLVGVRRAVQRDRARLRSIGPREIARLVEFEHELNDMIAAVVPTNIWLQQVTGGNFMQLYNEDVELMEDLMIANNQVVDSAKLVLRTIQNVRSASEAILASNLNATIRTLTILTILLTIPTIISSLFGMNVTLPLSDHPQAFWLVAVLIAMLVSLTVWYFKRNRWL